MIGSVVTLDCIRNCIDAGAPAHLYSIMGHGREPFLMSITCTDQWGTESGRS